MASPIKIADVYKLSKKFVKTQQQKLRLTIYVDPRTDDELIAQVCELLRPATGRSQVFVRILSGERGSDTALLGLEKQMTARLVLCRHAADVANLEPLPAATCVVVADELRSVAAHELGVSILDVVSPCSGDLEAQLAVWFSTTLPAKRLTIAGDFLFTRTEISHDICSVTSRQNAVIALVPFTRGADMPVLLANQCKMLFQLALIRGLKLNAKRIPELVVTAGIALVGRRLAGRLTSRFAPVRWVAQGAVAYGLTMALGQAACVYYEKRAQVEQEQAALKALNAAEQHLEAAGLDNPTSVLRGMLAEGSAAQE